MSGYISESLRRLVFDRAQGCCEYCRQHQSDNPFPYHIEHIIAEKHGGLSETNNLCLSCPECNRFKGSDIGSYDVLTETYTGLFHPRRQSWDEHFSIITKSAQLEPLTPQGRVTIFLLRLNSPEQLEARMLLLKLNRYPC